MQKFYILFSVFFIATISNAQFKSGEKLLSGSFNIASNNNGYLSNIYYSSDYTSMSIGTNISIARVKSENKIEGIKFGYNYNSQKNNDQLFNSNSNGYSINYFIQNIKKLKNDCFLFLEYGTGISYGQSKSNQQDSNTNVIATYKGIGVGGNAYANIGAGYRINKRLVCDITYGNIAYLGYNHSEQSTNKNNKSKQDSWQISSSLSQVSLGGLGFGLRLIF